MSRNRAVAATLTVAMLTAAAPVSACARHDAPRDLQPVGSVEASTSQASGSPTRATTRDSVVKIRGDSPNCDLGGSGSSLRRTV
jgi:hypothetical protein